MDLLEELKICIMAVESLKTSYLDHFYREQCKSNNINDLITGQYIAYASCHSILLDLVKKYEKEKKRALVN